MINENENETGIENYRVPNRVLVKILNTQFKILAILESEWNSEDDVLGGYISEIEAKKIFDRKSTWFWMMRSSGQLPFKKVGRKIFYHKADLHNLIENADTEEA